MYKGTPAPLHTPPPLRSNPAASVRHTASHPAARRGPPRPAQHAAAMRDGGGDGGACLDLCSDADTSDSQLTDVRRVEERIAEVRHLKMLHAMTCAWVRGRSAQSL